MASRVDITIWLQENQFEKAFNHIKQIEKSKSSVLNAHKLWAEIHENGDFLSKDMVFTPDSISEDLYEAIRIYFLLESTIWDDSKKAKYLSAMKDIVLQASNKFRMTYREGYIIDPALMVNIQDNIHLLENKRLFKDQADISAVKAQIAGTLLQLGMLKKYQFGSDMLQYAENYAKLGFKEKSVQIYSAIINDFNPDNDNRTTSFREAFPEVNFVNENNERNLEKDRYVFEKATYELNKINGVASNEPQYVVLDRQMFFHKLANDEQFRNQAKNADLGGTLIDSEDGNSKKSGLISKIRKFLKRNSN